MQPEIYHFAPCRHCRTATWCLIPSKRHQRAFYWHWRDLGKRTEDIYLLFLSIANKYTYPRRILETSEDFRRWRLLFIRILWKTKSWRSYIDFLSLNSRNFFSALNFLNFTTSSTNFTTLSVCSFCLSHHYIVLKSFLNLYADLLPVYHNDYPEYISAASSHNCYVSSNSILALYHYRQYNKVKEQFLSSTTSEQDFPYK